MSQIFRFKTNIKCSACVEKVTPYLNNLKGVEKWEVDTENPDKTLTVTAEELTDKEISNLISEAGYKAELL